MSLLEYMEKHNSLLADYVYYIDKGQEARRKYAKRNLLMGFHLWQAHRYHKKAMTCLTRNKKLERLYFKEHFNYELGA